MQSRTIDLESDTYKNNDEEKGYTLRPPITDDFDFSFLDQPLTQDSLLASLPDTTPGSWDWLSEFEVNLPQSSEPSSATKRKDMDAESPLRAESIFSPKHKKPAIEECKACPPLFDAVMNKVTSVLKRGTHGNPILDKLEIQWLNGQIIHFAGLPYRITPDEVKKLFTAMLTHNRQTYIINLWNYHEDVLKESLYQMDHESLYILFKELIKTSAHHNIKKYIWEKCNKFSDSVLKKDVVELNEIFFCAMINSPILLWVIKDLWKIKDVRKAMLSDFDADKTKILLEHSVRLPFYILRHFLAADRPLCKLIKSMPEVTIADQVFNYASSYNLSKEKLVLIVNLIEQSSVLEEVLSRIKKTNIQLKDHVSRTIEERVQSIKNIPRRNLR